MKNLFNNGFGTTFFLILLVLAPTACLSQTIMQKNIVHDEKVFQQLIGKSYRDRSLVNKGIFFRNAFLPGTVFFNSGDSIINIFLRYESLSDKLIWLSDGLGQVELESENVASFKLTSGDTTFRFSKYMVKSLNDSAGHFYQEFPGSKLKLLALRKVTKQDSYMKKKKYYIYAPDPVFIMNINNKEYLLEKPKVKSLIKLFPDKKEAINQQLKISGKIKDENDFLSFLKIIEDILIK